MKRRASVAAHIAVRGAVITALSAFGAAAEGFDAASPGLQPYQMVRSLQLVQDRIADGDHAALPMQKKLLELIDTRFRDADRQEFAERRNFDALMIYAMSGGNPTTVARSLEGLALDEADSAATTGVLAYLGGNAAAARDAMTAVDPSAQTQEVAAFLSLVKGSVVAGDDAGAGLAMLDRARLLAPGTLVEEAALRRTLSLAVTTGDAARFVQTAEQYARRFLRSPYAAQFAETFVSGIIALRKSIDLGRVETAVAWMTQEQGRTVYLRLARRAAIDGDTELLAFASQGAIGKGAGAQDGIDPRSELYSSISSVTSETVEAVLARLTALDAAQLSAADKALLHAARTVAQEVVAPVGVSRPEILEDAEAPGPAAEAPAPEPQKADPQPDSQPDPQVAAIRSRLAEIDRMLKESEP